MVAQISEELAHLATAYVRYGLLLSHGAYVHH